MEKMIVTIDNKEYEVLKPLKVIEDCLEVIKDCISHYSFSYYVEKGYIKEIKRDTPLSMGMILVREDGEPGRFICVPEDNGWFQIVCLEPHTNNWTVGHISSPYNTIECVNQSLFPYQFKIQGT